MSEEPASRQARIKRMALISLVIVLLSELMLAGCGKRPGYVDPPPDATEKRYPQTYPDPATDPKPDSDD